MTEYEALKKYDEKLNELFPSLTIAGYDFETARTLREISPVTYRDEFINWLDSEGIDLD